MDLIENIRIFKRVAELGSFSAASQEFQVSQPTISKAVRSLEERLGVSILRRTTRGLSVTEEGRKLLLTGTLLLEQAEVMFAAVKNEKLLLQGPLKVTASLAFARLILAPVLEEFSEAHPGLRLTFHLSDGYVDLVENGIDLAIRIGELEDSTLKARKVGRSRRALYASTTYIQKFGKPNSIEELKRHRLLSYTRASDRPHWPLFKDDGTPELFYFEPYLQSDGSDLMREAVLQGLGVAMMPTWMMSSPMKEKIAVKILDKYAQPSLPIYVVTAGAQEMSAKQRAYTEFLLKVFEKNPELSL